MGSKLLEYCTTGNVSKVEKLLKSISESDLFEKNEHGLTALHVTCRCGYTEIVQLLLDHLMNSTKITPTVTLAFLNEKDEYGRTVLHVACCIVPAYIAQLLFNHPFTSKTMKLLLCEKDDDGKTALHYVCENGQTEVVKLLLDHPLSLITKLICKRDNYNLTALPYATWYGHTEIVQLIEGYIRKVNVRKLTSRTYYAKVHLSQAMITPIFDIEISYNFKEMQILIFVLFSLSKKERILDILDMMM